MKPVSAVLETLRARDLLELAQAVADDHHVELDEVCSRVLAREISEARHALWERLYRELGNYSAIARIFDVDHSTVVYAISKFAPIDQPPIVQVLLEVTRVDGETAALLWAARGRGADCYGIYFAGQTEWFFEYPVARDRFREFSGVPTFAAAARARAPDPSPPIDVASVGGGGAQ